MNVALFIVKWWALLTGAAVLWLVIGSVVLRERKQPSREEIEARKARYRAEVGR